MFNFFKKRKKEVKFHDVREDNLLTVKTLLECNNKLSPKETQKILDLIRCADLTYYSEKDDFPSKSILYYGLVYGTPEIAQAMLEQLPDITKNVSYLGTNGWQNKFRVTLSNVIAEMKPENLAVYLKYVPATYIGPNNETLLEGLIENYSANAPENSLKNICLLIENGVNPAELENLPDKQKITTLFKYILQRPLSEKETELLTNLIPHIDINDCEESSTSLLFYGLMYGSPKVVDAMMKNIPDITKNVHYIGSNWDANFTLTNIVPHMKPENLEVYLKYVPATHTSPEGKSLLAECLEPEELCLSNSKYCIQNARILLGNGVDAREIKDEKTREMIAQYDYEKGNTLFHIAAKKNNLFLAQNLINANFPMQKNEEGKYPEDYAASSMMFHILSVARKKGERTPQRITSQTINPSLLAQKEQHTRIN